jgi:hypothetical protein
VTKEEVARLRRELRLISLALLTGGLVLIGAANAASTAGDPGFWRLAVVGGSLLVAAGCSHWYTRGFGVEARRLPSSFEDMLRSKSSTTPFRVIKARCVRTRDDETYGGVVIMNGYVLRVGMRTRLRFDPHDVIEVILD